MMAGRYEIRGKLGQGGLGAIYLAYDQMLHREVALKRIISSDAHSASPETSNQLAKEAGALSALQHPHIVTIFDVGVDHEGPFVVMELLQGKTVDEVVESAIFTWEDFREFALQTQEALIAAQDLNMVHRDLKPSNIMLTWLPSGKFQVKIVDFGLAKYTPQPSPQTADQSDAVFGSIFFMAPEQFERVELDARTDMYAIGCVYYYTLTGLHPFAGDTGPQVMASHLNHQVYPLHEIRPDLPRWVSDWIMWHINRLPEHRPTEARQALEVFLQNAQRSDSEPSTSSGHQAQTTNRPPAPLTSLLKTAPQRILPPDRFARSSIHTSPLIPDPSPAQAEVAMEQPSSTLDSSASDPEIAATNMSEQPNPPSRPRLLIPGAPSPASSTAPAAATPAAGKPRLLIPGAAAAPAEPTAATPIIPAAPAEIPVAIPVAVPVAPAIEPIPVAATVHEPAVVVAIAPAETSSDAIVAEIPTPSVVVPQATPIPQPAVFPINDPLPSEFIPIATPVPVDEIVHEPAEVVPLPPVEATPPVTESPAEPAPTSTAVRPRLIVPGSTPAPAPAPAPVTAIPIPPPAAAPVVAPPMAAIAPPPVVAKPTLQVSPPAARTIATSLAAPASTQPVGTPVVAPAGAPHTAAPRQTANAPTPMAPMAKKKAMSNGAKAALATVLGLLVIIIAGLIISNSAKSKINKRYNSLVQLAAMANTQELPVNSKDLSILLDSATSLAASSSRETVYKALYIAESADGSDIDATILAYTLNTPMNEEIRVNMLSRVIAGRIKRGHKEEATADALVAFIQSNPKPTSAAAAIGALREMATDKHFADLLQLLQFASDANVRKACEEVIVQIIKKSSNRTALDQSAEPAFAAASSPEVKQALLRVLGAIGSPKAKEIVLQQMKGSDKAMQIAAADATKHWPDASMVESVIEALTTADDPALRRRMFHSSREFLLGEVKRSDQQNQKLWQSLADAARGEEEQIAVISSLVTSSSTNQTAWAPEIIRKYEQSSQIDRVVDMAGKALNKLEERKEKK